MPPHVKFRRSRTRLSCDRSSDPSRHENGDALSKIVDRASPKATHGCIILRRQVFSKTMHRQQSRRRKEAPLRRPRAGPSPVGLGMDFEALADFRLVVLHGGFGKASRATGKPKASLSKRVINLENKLGVRLFDREGGRLHLTEEGRQLYGHAEHLLDEVDQIREEIGAGVARPRGKLRVAAPNLFSHLWLGRLSARFLMRYPEVTIEAILLDRPVDFSDEWFDLLIQVNPGPLVGLVGRIIARDQVRILAPKSLIAGMSIADGMEVPAILPAGAPVPASWNITIGSRSVTVRPRFNLQLPSRLMVRDAVREGLGFAELPKSIVTSDLRSGVLVDVGPAPIEKVEVWALHASRRLPSRKVTAFIDFLCEFFRDAVLEF